MQKRKNKYNFTFILGLGLILIGLSALSHEYFKSKKIEVFEKMNIALYESEIPEDIISDSEIIVPDEPVTPGGESNNEEISSEEPQQKPKPVDYSKYYVGTLEIPKINLKKGFLDIDSPYNNVNKNVTVIQSSSYPDIAKGNFILAAHTGSSSVSFFTKLHDLKIDDLAYIHYKQKKYTYKLVNIYTQPKVGYISIYRDTSKTTLTLVTCTKNAKTTQTIFILELINIE